jgi:hypothetical protein
MAALVTLAVAKGHVRIDLTDTAGDADLTLKIAQASETIVGWMTPALADATWTDLTAPSGVQKLVLRYVAFLQANRGDVPVDPDPRPEIVRELIALGYRDPVLA